MNRIQKFAAFYVALALAIIYGYSVGRFQLFPYSAVEPLVQDFQQFSQGDTMEKESTILDKLKNDFGLSPERLTYLYPEHAAKNAIKSGHSTLDHRDEEPLIFVQADHRKGYRTIVGALDLADSFWGALLINQDGEIIHSWSLSTEHINDDGFADQQKALYGVHVFPDGSIIFSMQEIGGGIVKVDPCSNLLWTLKGNFHHAISPDDNGYFWTFIGQQATFDQNLARVSVATGEIAQVIEMAEVRRLNPDVHIWDLRAYDPFGKQQALIDGHMSHGNDVEPLPAALASSFPSFEPGDLLVSNATTNLIFVLDPHTLEVKWWRMGVSDLQHDPDWEPDGTISIFSNNTRISKPFSDIVSIDPASMKHHVILDGTSLAFKSNFNGRQQLTEFNTTLVTSSQQGWAFEIDSEGEIVFSFVNAIDSKAKKAMHLSESTRYPEDYFDSRFWETCTP